MELLLKQARQLIKDAFMGLFNLSGVRLSFIAFYVV